VDPSGTITTIAGNGIPGFSGDGGPATQASLNYPWGLTIDAAGNLYIADRANSRVRKLAGAAAGAVTPGGGGPPPSLGPPSLPDYSVVNGASFVTYMPIAPGAIATLFGTDFATGPAAATTTPLPTVLGETSVTFNGIPAPLFYVSAGQINVQAPFELPMGTATVQVKRGNLVSAVRSVSVNPISPGIFVMDQTTKAGAILHADFTLVSSSSPARPGESLLIFCTGLGAVRGAVKSGDRAPSTPPLADTITTPVVSIGGQLAPVTFSGLAPGFIGLYQVNVVVPAGVGAGNQSVQITTGGIVSNTATVAVTR